MISSIRLVTSNSTRSIPRCVLSTTMMARPTGSRFLSSQTTSAIEKLRNVLEQYRLENYTQELPTRFKKEIIQAACKQTATQSLSSTTVDNNVVVLEGMQRVLHNIGASEQVSLLEMKAIFDELGNGQGGIHTQKLIQIL